MLEMYAADFIWIGSTIRYLMGEMAGSGELIEIPESYMKSVSPRLSDIAERCKTLELPVSEAIARHWEEEFKTASTL